MFWVTQLLYVIKTYIFNILTMMYLKLLDLINQITHLEEKESELIKNCFKPLQLTKGEFFLEAGKYAGPSTG